jgi:hypothetical protein
MIKLVFQGSAWPIELEHATELARRLRRIGGGEIESPSTALAIALDHLLEQPSGELKPVELKPGEELALWNAIEDWMRDSELPDEVLALRDPLDKSIND